MRGPGESRWSWDPLVHDGIVAGAANVWAPMSSDEERGLVFLPTSSPSPDFWGGKRPGNDEHANSVVALRAETGELVWSFQTVHHDVWDYDLPAQPTLARIDTGEGMRDVVIQPTKQGFVFVLDRDTGKPIWPVEERGVPQGGAEGEQLSPTQPFPTHVPALMPQQILRRRRVQAVSDCSRSSSCEKQLAAARNEGLFTPPSTQGTLIFPMTGGGVNWGGAAFDPVNQILYANTSRAVHIVKLIPRAEAEGFKPPPGIDFGPQRGAPFAMTRARRDVAARHASATSRHGARWSRSISRPGKSSGSRRSAPPRTRRRSGSLSTGARRWSTASRSPPAVWSSPARWTRICAPSTPNPAQSCGRAGCRCPASPIP